MVFASDRDQRHGLYRGAELVLRGGEEELEAEACKQQRRSLERKDASFRLTLSQTFNTRFMLPQPVFPML